MKTFHHRRTHARHDHGSVGTNLDHLPRCQRPHHRHGHYRQQWHEDVPRRIGTDHRHGYDRLQRHDNVPRCQRSDHRHRFRRDAASVEVTRAHRSDLGNSRRCEFVRGLAGHVRFGQTGHRSRHRPMTESDPSRSLVTNFAVARNAALVGVSRASLDNLTLEVTQRRKLEVRRSVKKIGELNEDGYFQD